MDSRIIELESLTLFFLIIEKRVQSAIFTFEFQIQSVYEEIKK